MARKIETAFTLSGETEYKRSIKEISSEQTTLNAELRKVNDSMKNNGVSQDGLKDKARILNQQVETQQERIDALNEKLAEANQLYPDGGIEVDKYKKQLHDAERFMQGYEQQLKETNDALADTESKLKKTGDALKQSGQDMQDTGKKLTMGLTAPLLGVATAALKFGDDADSAFNKFRGATGVAEEETDELRQAMENIYFMGYGESIEEVADVMTLFKNNTSLASDEIENATEKALLLADTLGIEVEESVFGVNILMEQFGMTADEAYDLIAVGAQKGANQNGDLIDTIAEFAPAYKDMGYSAEEMFQTLIKGSEDGVFQINKIADAANEFGTRMMDGSDTTREALELIGLSAEQMTREFSQGGDIARGATDKIIDGLLAMEDPLERETAGVNLFGSMWEDMGIEGIRALQGVEDGALEVRGAMDQIAEVRYESLGEALTILGRQSQDALLPIANQLTPAIIDGIEWASDKVEFLTDKFNGLDDAQQIFITRLGAGLAAVGPATVGIGKLTEGVGNMMERAAGAADGTGKLSAALGGGGKMALVGIAIAASVAIYQYARNVDNLSNNLRKSREAVKEAREEYDKSTAAIEDSAGMAMSLVAQIKDLQKAEELSNDEKIRMRTLIGQLNGLYPQLGLEIDEVTGKVEGLEESIDDMVKRMIDQQRIAANETVMTELANEAAGMYGKMTEAEEAWVNAKAEAQAEDSRLTDEYLDLLARRMGVGDDLTEQENERLDRYITEQGLVATHQMDLMELLFTYMGYSDEYESIQGQIADIATDTQDIVTDSNEKQGDSVDDLAERVSRATEGTKASWKAYQEEHVGTLSYMRDNYEWYIDEYGNLQKEDTTNLERTQEEQRIIQENAKKREEDLQNEILANEEKWLDLRRTARETNLSNQEKYQSDLETELGNQLGILSAFAEDEFKSLEASAEQHYQHNKKKMEAYQGYTSNMSDLRGRVSDEMYAELEKMGPEHAGLIAEYAGMTESELSKHSDQWVDIYETMGETAKTEVQKVPEVTAEELGKLAGIIRDEEGNIYNAATDALGYVTEAIRQEAPESEGQMDALVERVREKAKTDLSELGKGAISTYSDAMEDWRPEAEEQAIALALAVFESSDGSLEERGAEAVQTYVDAMAEAEIDAINQAMRMARGVEGAAETHLFDQGAEGIHGYMDGQESKRSELEHKTAELAKIPKEKMNVSLISEGEHGATTYASGIRNKTPGARQASKDMAQAAKTSAKTSFNAEGVNAGASFADGIKSQRWRVQNEASGLGTAAKNSLKSVMQIASPSKVMTELGEFTGEGFAVGIKDKIKEVEKAAAQLGDAAHVTGKMSVTGEVIGGHRQSGTQAGSMSVSATVDSQVIAEAVARGLSGVGVYMDGRSMGQMIAKDSARGRVAVGGIV